jgi:hypothetical protein
MPWCRHWQVSLSSIENQLVLIREGLRDIPHEGHARWPEGRGIGAGELFFSANAVRVVKAHEKRTKTPTTFLSLYGDLVKHPKS